MLVGEADVPEDTATDLAGLKSVIEKGVGPDVIAGEEVLHHGGELSSESQEGRGAESVEGPAEGKSGVRRRSGVLQSLVSSRSEQRVDGEISSEGLGGLVVQESRMAADDEGVGSVSGGSLLGSPSSDVIVARDDVIGTPESLVVIVKELLVALASDTLSRRLRKMSSEESVMTGRRAGMRGAGRATIGAGAGMATIGAGTGMTTAGGGAGTATAGAGMIGAGGAGRVG